MTTRAIVDTGPLVAFLDRSEKNHRWTVEQIQKLAAPLLVCEPVLTEACFLLRNLTAAGAAILELVSNRSLIIDFSLLGSLREVSALRRKYQDTPMSLADACIVSMAELHNDHAVFTLDSDFEIYRKNGREPLELIIPKPRD